MHKKISVIIFVIGICIGCQVSVTPSTETAENGSSTNSKTHTIKNGKLTIKKSDKSGKSKEITIENSEKPNISIEVKKGNKLNEKNNIDSEAVSDNESAEDDIFVDGNSKDLEFNCEERNVIIEGNNHIIKLNGECNLLSVIGNGHRIDVETVSTIKVTGNENQIVYEYGTNNRKPSIKKTGRKNRVLRKSRR